MQLFHTCNFQYKTGLLLHMDHIVHLHLCWSWHNTLA
uniref:Uncharacterized protein n=1 Tax=Arundo donax TaxID=35708 RepID=A0A0A9BGH6_ARUDO